MTAARAKQILLQTLAEPKNPYARLQRILERNPGVSASARVYRTCPHYVHKRSVTLDLTVEGELNNGDSMDDTTETGKLIDQVQEEMRTWVVDYCGKITKNLEQDLEYQQSDEAVADSLDANERYFDVETGDEVDMPHLVTADQLPAHVQLRLVQQHTDLLNVTPQQVIQDLTRRGLKFDQSGEQVDTATIKKVSELPDEVREIVLDNNRNWNTDDDYWSESTIEFYKEDLEDHGFRRVEINYSLGGMQGDGASFTADSVDVEQFLKKMTQQKKVEAQAAVLVRELMLCG